nr:MAG TPA: hypothetical protein [Caudoviricetes sp.]
MLNMIPYFTLSCKGGTLKSKKREKNTKFN